MFACSVCGTCYLHEDTRKLCEERKLFDQLKAEKGERILTTRYVGQDWPPEGKKGGLQRLWSWTYVRDKRIVPASEIICCDQFHHVAEYKFGDINQNYLPEYPELADRWEEAHVTIIGPYHHWSRNCDLSWMKSKLPWEGIVKSMCYGEDTEETLAKLKAEGYPV